jgi:branched-chain amino acid transport system permease protein
MTVDLRAGEAPAATGAKPRGALRAFLVRRAPWLAFALALVVMPQVFRTGTALTVMSLMGIAIVYALSYNMLLGQTGMLSFGHAVYYGFGAYATVHAINAASAAAWPIPLPLMPLVGGLGGLAAAILFGYVSTRRGGTVFAMISLGLGELVGSSSLILRSFFGGEEGVSTNRTRLPHVLGWTFGPAMQVYWLIAAWCFVCAAVMYALTRTPFGRMCNAVRDNPERAQFVGYSPHVVRFLAFSFAGFFAGIAGGLVAIHFELANAALFGAAQSGSVLLATFIGGAGHFGGPILGAVLITWLQNMLSDFTEVWQLYFGLLFMATVVHAPGGLAGLVMMHRPFWRAGALGRVLRSYSLLVVPVALATVGAVMAIEMTAHLRVRAAEGSTLRMFGTTWDVSSWRPWALALVLVAVGLVLVRLAWRAVGLVWDEARTVAKEKGVAT